MGMPKVDNFMHCLSLNTAGLVAGWMTLIVNGICSLSCVLLIITTIAVPCKEIETFFSKNGENPEHACGLLRIFVIYFFGIAAVICFGLAYIGRLCVSGTLDRRVRKLTPMLYLLGIGIILSILSLFDFSLSGLFMTLVEGSIFVYLFVCIYSLREKVKAEVESNFGVHVPMSA